MTTMEEKPVQTASRLRAESVTLGYPGNIVARSLTVSLPDDAFTAIVGPNACGKSTLLKALARVTGTQQGSVYLDGRAISSYGAKEVARRLGLLAQSATAPEGITVGDLVARGRYPHQTMLRQWSDADERAVNAALAQTGVTDLAARFVDELSGGQRQRVWLAMALAQETSILLLDEPTTFLDLGHQYEILDLCARLHAGGRTIAAVLHDLNQAARYATHVIALAADGTIAAEGPPEEVITAELVDGLFGLPCRIIPDPETGTPMVVPRSRNTVPAAHYS
ncbi:ABC transporter ATP-binding protein [Longispora albida]|uniref:ABC transporter ATP-binding protein n=1 Tax=Longispora albida TaxID=203523 RepID=UPI00035E6307|nr:ABC transporter ATP-binding protein [Longispora albida]